MLCTQCVRGFSLENVLRVDKHCGMAGAEREVEMRDEARKGSEGVTLCGV